MASLSSVFHPQTSGQAENHYPGSTLCYVWTTKHWTLTPLWPSDAKPFPSLFKRACPRSKDPLNSNHWFLWMRRNLTFEVLICRCHEQRTSECSKDLTPLPTYVFSQSVSGWSWRIFYFRVTLGNSPHVSLNHSLLALSSPQKLKVHRKTCGHQPSMGSQVRIIKIWSILIY